MGEDVVNRHAGNHWRSLLIIAAAAVVLCGATWPTEATAAVGVPVTYLDQAYPPTVNKPSENKPQSKLWYHDGSWWALMANSAGTVTIHRLNRAEHTWRDTGTLVDDRLNSTGDALWSARDSKLYVASRVTGSNLEVTAFSYHSAAHSWTVVPRFPVTVASGGGSESATIDQNSIGELWVTYTRSSRVWVAHSTNDRRTTWTPGSQPNVPDTTIKSDDLSAVIAFGDSVGVLWSDQQTLPSVFRFAIHKDGAPDDAPWRVEQARGPRRISPNLADDHINLKQLVGDAQGRIFAAVKTSANDVAGAPLNDPLVGVLTRTPGPNGGPGTWSFDTAGTVADDHSRPIIMIDKDNQELYFFATAPVQGGDIYYKHTPLSNVDFSDQPNRGEKFVDATPVVNNASGAKDPVTRESGLVILAVAEGQKRYVHAEMALPGDDRLRPP